MLSGVAARLRIEPVTPQRWDDLVELFERPGPRGGTPTPGSCWCMAYRGNGPSRAVRKAAMRDLVERGDEPGLLAYLDDVPMGWVAVAPREDHVGIARSRTLRPRDTDTGVFSITCFYVDPTARGEGLSSALLDAAVEHASSRGGAIVEAYPKAAVAEHAKDGGSAEQGFSFMGRPGAYERRGFTHHRDAGARVVVRRSTP
jgi:GNAT superfamily N-acetyltransferase